jgi:hypothetical protein
MKNITGYTRFKNALSHIKEEGPSLNGIEDERHDGNPSGPGERRS